jgi:hypothetical protein
MKIIITVFLLCGLCFISACNRKSKTVASVPDLLFAKWIYKEIMRVESPDSKVDAVVVTGDGGATTRTYTYIFLVPHNGKTDQNDDHDLMFIGDLVSNLKVSWKEPRFLEIYYDEAEIYKFSNIWQSHGVDDFHHVVELRLFPQKDYSVPFDRRYW